MGGGRTSFFLGAGLMEVEDEVWQEESGDGGKIKSGGMKKCW
jgi:hypothetical protein